MSSIIIRDCQRQDLERVFELEQSCFPRSPTLPFVAVVQYFDLFKKTFVVAEAEGKIIGFAIIGSCSLEPQSTWLLDIDEYFGKGEPCLIVQELFFV